MTSDYILIVFKPIDLNEAVQYLKGYHYTELCVVVRDFIELTEEEMANYKYPDTVYSIKEGILDSRYGKDSNRYRDFNTLITGISLIKSCAQINVAIYTLQKKYKEYELLYGTSYHSYSSMTHWFNSTDEDVLRIKDAAIVARDKINGFSKKYTIDGFEENFINKIKYSVYAINRTFMIDTRTIGQKTEDFGIEVFGRIVLYGVFFLLFFLVAKCASGL